MNGTTEVIAVFWEWLERAVSLFWSGLGWPHTILLIFVIAMAFYRQEIRALIERILEIGPGGFKLLPPPVSTLHSEKIESSELQVPMPTSVAHSPALPAAEGSPLPLPPVIFPEQLRISKGYVTTETAGMSDAQAKEYLTSMLSFSRVTNMFENCYSMIFGGQLKLLQLLNQRPGWSISLSELNSIWASHQNQIKPLLDLWTTDQYLQYLINHGLIVRVADSIQMTTKGSEFLIWLVSYSRPLERPY